MSDKIRIGLVGCGGIANAHLEAYEMLHAKGCDHFEITALVDPISEAAARFAETIMHFQGTTPKHFNSVDQLINAGIVDGVDVCTPHADHHVTAVRCLESGIYVLVEKPLGVTVRAARLICDAAKRSGNILSVAENSRRGLGQRAMTWLFNQHKLIGDARMFLIDYMSGPKLPLASEKPPEAVSQVNWRYDKLQSGGGWTYDGGVHLMDSLLVYFGEIETVHAELRTLKPAVTLLTDGRKISHPQREDVCIATFQFANGVIGSWTWSFALPGVEFNRVAFYCEKGYVLDNTPGGWTHTFGGGFIPSEATLYLPDGKTLPSRDLELEYLLSLKDDERERLFPHGVMRSVAQECHEFIDCIREKRSPEVDAEKGLDALAVAAAIYESSLLNQTVKVADVRASRIDGFQRDVDEYWGLV